MKLNSSQNIFAIALVLLMTNPTWAWQVNTGEYSIWFQSLQLPIETLTPLKSYFTQNSPAEVKVYGDNILATYKKAVSLFVTNLQNGQLPSCEIAVNVKFDKNITASNLSQTSAFEEELLQMEAVSCLPNLDLEKTVEIFYSDSFQLKYLDGLKASQSDESNNIVCQSTKVFGIGASNFCSRYSFWRNQTTIAAFSVNIKNDPAASAPVHLRLVTTIFHKLQDGRILVYNLTYGRGPNLPLHVVVKSTVAKQQKSLMLAITNEAR